jgi:hypothetical protein
MGRGEGMTDERAISTEDLTRLVHAVERLTDALAKRVLDDWKRANIAAGTPEDWPGDQSWDDLVSTSHAIFRQQAREEAGLDRTPAFREWLDSFGVEWYGGAPDDPPVPRAEYWARVLSR